MCVLRIGTINGNKGKEENSIINTLDREIICWCWYSIGMRDQHHHCAHNIFISSSFFILFPFPYYHFIPFSQWWRIFTQEIALSPTIAASLPAAFIHRGVCVMHYILYTHTHTKKLNINLSASKIEELN